MADLEPLAYSDGDTQLHGLLARPNGTPKAGILVYPTIMNTTGSVEDKARALADAGYIALVADFYGRTPADFDEARSFAAEVRQDIHAYRARLRAAIKALVSLDEARELPLAAIGFCMGGGAVLELARDGAPLKAVVSFHGLLTTELPAEPGAISARILVCHGDADPMVPRSHVIDFWEEMDASKGNWHFHSYAGVKHGFTNPGSPADSPALGYDASADRQSWASMHSLFDEVFS
jgi:dienelactone hydrolase